MSDQYHDPYQQHRQPRQPRDPYDEYGQHGHQSQHGQPGQHGQQYDGYGQQAPYDPQAGHTATGGGSYDYPYQQPQQQQPYPQQPHQQQGGTAWPTAGDQQAWAPAEEPSTQTWQTQSWDTEAWQQQLPVAEPSYGSAAPAWSGAPDRAADAAAWPQVQQPGRAAAFTAEPARQDAAYAPVPAVAEEPAKPMTAAEKAKAEGRPQILSPGFRPALLTAVLAALVALAAPVGQAALAVPVVLLQAVTAAGWFRLNGMWPARQGIALAFLGGLVADAGLLAAKAEQAPTVVLGTLGVWLLLTVMLQLRSHASPDERLYGLTTAAGSAALAVLAAGHLSADQDAVVVGALAVAATVLARALPLPSAAAPVVALIAAAGAGVLGGQLTHTGGSAALLGLAAGACALIGLRVASYDYPSRFVHMTAGVALPLALAGPVVYVLGRALF
ncbi:hypothetical protein [Streptomyces sp. I05A-00742]|uniref:hypothetical protein n=1 Tax=Streptomyces sp. I05A-00742 TaxID=2732853 RepID=UPI0014898E9C|nr:hypothetical protein [Streptomyces sp. I05A-00742]